jgi:hypothetical protein
MRIIPLSAAGKQQCRTARRVRKKEKEYTATREIITRSVAVIAKALQETTVAAVTRTMPVVAEARMPEVLSVMMVSEIRISAVAQDG